jgi:hypothetical protein
MAIFFWGGKRVTALSLQAQGNGQVQCTLRRNFALFYHLNIQRHYSSVRSRGAAGDRQWGQFLHFLDEKRGPFRSPSKVNYRLYILRTLDNLPKKGRACSREAAKPTPRPHLSNSPVGSRLQSPSARGIPRLIRPPRDYLLCLRAYITQDRPRI